MFRVIDLSDEKTWNHTVLSFENYDVHYLNEYVKLFSNEGNVKLFYLELNDDIKAMKIYIIRDIAEDSYFMNKLKKNEFFDIITPYGYGGFIVDGKKSKEIDEVFFEHCIRSGYISEFVRLNLIDSYEVNHFQNGVIEDSLSNIICDLTLTEDELWKNFRYDVRKNIRIANENGLHYIIEHNSKNIDKFLEIYYSTMDRNNADNKYYFDIEFFLNLSKLTSNYFYIYVFNQDEVISTELVLYGPDNGYSFLGGTRSEFFRLRPNEFLKFEIMKHLKEIGVKRFIIGGGKTDNDGIFKYKKKFFPTGVKKFKVGKRIFDRVKYNYLIDLRNNDNEAHDYFPAYRKGS